jgi:U4/U6 small nuclear ribonucleoprotein PRP31
MKSVEMDLISDLENELLNQSPSMAALDEQSDDEESDISEEGLETLIEQESYLDEELKKIANVEQIAKLLKSQRLSDIIVKVEKHSEQGEMKSFTGLLEHSPEYRLILEANDVFLDIESEMLVVYRFIKQHYGKRFAELEKIVPNILDYVKVVKAIGNEMDMAKVNLGEIVANTTVMVITMTASTSAELKLPSDELHRVFDACDMVLDLEEIRKKVGKGERWRFANGRGDKSDRLYLFQCQP